MIEFKILNLKNMNLNIIEGSSVKNPKAIVINIHGIGSHFQTTFPNKDSIKYRNLFFFKNDMKMYALEFHGHGKSDGIKCSIDNFDDLVDDLYCLIKYINDITKFKKLPKFIMAGSMGGAVAIKFDIKYFHENLIKGYILLSPMCGINKKIILNPLFISILIEFSKCFPTFQFLETNNNFDNSCTNIEYIKYKKTCKYFYSEKIRLNTIRECYNAMLWIQENGSLFNSPLFLIHAQNDTITDYKMSLNFFNEIPVKNKKKYFPENSEHLLLVEKDNFDEEPDYIWEQIIDWINQQLKSC